MVTFLSNRRIEAIFLISGASLSTRLTAETVQKTEFRLLPLKPPGELPNAYFGAISVGSERHTMAKVVKVTDLSDGCIIAKDIYINSSVLYRSGTLVTPSLAEDLSEKGVIEISIKNSQITAFHRDFLEEQGITSHRLQSLTDRFQNDMSVIADELRYGRILHSEASYKWLRSVYLRTFSNPTVILLMDSLKQWDPICYTHSVDVFVLCSLYIRRFHMKLPKGFILGCLLHDIGKLYTPRPILLKTGKLTEREYEIIKEHTLQGYELLSKLKFPAETCKIARSHHERLNGSGYPDQYTVPGKDIDLKAMMIADIYSALTLKRSYRNPMHATRAMQILLNECLSNKLDMKNCFAFINFVRIFPPATQVLLTNGEVGTVMTNRNGSDILPKIKLQDRDNVIQLPSDLSLTVKKVVGWDSSDILMQEKQNWHDYIQNLIDGNTVRALELLDALSDGKRIENVFIDLIERSMHEIREGADSQRFQPADMSIARTTTLTLLNWKMLKLLPDRKTEMGAVIIANLDSAKELLPMKMINDLFAINGWKTLFLGNRADLAMITDLIERKSARYLAVSLSEESQLFPVNHIIHLLRCKYPDLIIFIHGSSAHLIDDLTIGTTMTSTSLSEFVINLRSLFSLRTSGHKKT